MYVLRGIRAFTVCKLIKLRGPILRLDRGGMVNLCEKGKDAENGIVNVFIAASDHFACVKLYAVSPSRG